MINNWIDIHFDGDTNEDQVNQYPVDDRPLGNDNDDNPNRLERYQQLPFLHYIISRCKSTT